jgi:uncharacterized phage infection (PIP) family protein YhgE
MRKYLQFALAAVALLFGAATLFTYSQLRESESSNATLQSASRTTQDQYAQTIDAIAEIQDSLNAITPGDGAIRLESSSLQTERRMGPPTAKEALERISQLRASIDRSKARISRLESELHGGKLRVAGLQKLVAGLRKTTAEKEQQIAVLAAQVGELQTQVTGLTTEVAQVRDTVRTRESELSDRRLELATVYWVADNKRALTRSGVIEARGGVLGIGKTLKPTARTGNAAFQAIDTDAQTVIQLSSAKAQVLTPQPLSSYELKLVNGKMELHILSPQEFRKVRQLVIVTA